MEKIKFSVLIPVYNVENYLKQCIDSVLAQNYNNLEIILVDDGSTDSSGSICDEYAENDKRIKVIHKKNEGLLSARRTAIKVASGDYFLFLDSDDYWEVGLLNRITNIIKKHNCDMVIFRCKNVYKNRVIDAKKLFENENVFSQNEKIKLYKLILEGEELNNLVTKVVKNSIVDKENDYHNMRDVSYGEDALQSVPLLLKAEKIVYISDAMYYYRKNIGMTKTIRAHKICSITKVKASIIKAFESLEIEIGESVEILISNYIKVLPRHILYGYSDNPKKLREALDYVFETDLYKKAKKEVYNKSSLFNKTIIWLAENRYYKLISLFAYALKQRNRLKELGKKEEVCL